MTESTDPQSETRALVEQYKQEQDWEELREAAEESTAAVRTLAGAMVDQQIVNTRTMTALYRLTQHDRKFSADSKIQEIQELDISAETKEVLVDQITENLGSVGGPLFDLQIPEAYEEATLELLRNLVRESDNTSLDNAIQEYASLEISGIQSGMLTPIIHYLHPRKYPIVNGTTRPGMEEFFGVEVSQQLTDYLDAVAKFQSVRDEYEFQDHYRHLDYFFIWADRQEPLGDPDYFILRTGSDEWADTPSEEYHFREGIPGSRQLREATRPHVVFSEEGELYATAVIEEITSRERNGETHYFAQIEDYEEIDPIPVSSVRHDLEASLGVQYGIIKISEEDYGKIVHPNGGGRYFWANTSSSDWIERQEQKFYTSKTPDGNTRRIKQAFERARPNDRVVLYEISPSQRITGIGRIAEGLHEESAEGFESPVGGITIVGEERIEGPHWETMVEAEQLQDSTPIRSDNSMYFGELEASEFRAILELSEEKTSDHLETLRERLSLPRLSIARPEGLYFDDADELFRQIEGTLNSGKHIIFVGPPGTGKTKLAKEIARYCKETYTDHIDNFRFTTATSAWTTFDTIGGYVPRQQKGGDELVFQPRIFLNCFRDNTIRNDWLVIDEINRSDIDKAFGQLFSVLSGDTVELPYERERPVEIVALEEKETEEALREIVDGRDLFPVTPSWRLLATMNTYDKASLYELSYAFMRRFNFVHVGVPELKNENGVIRSSLLDPSFSSENYATKWVAADDHLEETLQAFHRELAVLWERINRSRRIGPSIIRDMIGYMAVTADKGEPTDLLTDAVIALVFPQLEGMRPQEQRQLIESLSAEAVVTEGGEVTVELDNERLRRKAEDFFNIEFEDDE